MTSREHVTPSEKTLSRPTETRRTGRVRAWNGEPTPMPTPTPEAEAEAEAEAEEEEEGGTSPYAWAMAMEIASASADDVPPPVGSVG